MAQTAGISKIGFNDDPSMWSFGAPEYSPETLAYLQALEAAAAARNPGIGNYYSGLQQTGSLASSDVNLPIYNTDAAFAPYIGQPIADNLGYQFSPVGKWGSTGQVSVGNQTPVVLVNDKTGETVYSGIGFEAGEEIARQVEAMGKSAPWSIYTASPGGTEYYRAAQNEPQMGLVEGLGKLALTVGPVVAAGALAPTLAASGAGGAGAGGVGGAAGGAGGIGGTAAGLGTTLAPELGAYAINVAGGLGGGAGLGAGLAGGLGAGLGSMTFGGTSAGTVAPPPNDPYAISVTGTPPPGVMVPPIVPPPLGGGGIGYDPSYDPTAEFTVEAPVSPEAPPIPPLTLGPFGPLTSTPVTMPPEPIPEIPGDGGILGTGIGIGDIPTLVTGLTGVIGGLVGDGGGGGTGGPLDGGGTVDIPAAVTASRRTPIAPTYDPFTYGQAGSGQPGEFRFYEGYANGGEVEQHAAAWDAGIGHRGPGQVAGIGSGQSDEIPAWLSDGEYVWSAQDVADLGDGSTDEGVRRLDEMRKHVRKRAGRKDTDRIAKPQQGIGHLLNAVGA